MYITSILLPRKVNKKEGKNKNENHNHTFLFLFPKPINITSLLFPGNRVDIATRQRSRPQPIWLPLHTPDFLHVVLSTTRNSSQ